MKMFKKILAVAAVLAMGCVSAFAFDDEYAMVENIGAMSRAEFEQTMELCDEDLIADLFMSELGDDVELTDFFLMDEEDMDDEEVELQAYIEKQVLNSSAKKNDTFVSAIIRTMDDEDYFIDGWMVMTHYLSKKDIKHYIFYFAAEF